MRIEIYLSDGEVVKTRIEIEEHEDEEKIMENAAGNMMEHINKTGFVCIPESGGYRVINANAIKEMKIIPAEKEKQNADV